MPRRADRVAHVVDAVEGRDEVVAGTGERLRGRHLERRTARHAGVRRPLARELDRGLVVVRAAERRRRERLGHEHRRRAVPAPDVGDPGSGLQLLHDPVERREPLGHEVGAVAGAEERLAAEEHVLVLLVPPEALPGPEPLGDPRLGAQRPERQHERAGQVERPVRVGERERLLLGERERPGRGVVLGPAARRLLGEPLGDVADVGAGAGGEGRRVGRALGEGPVEPEAVPDDDAAGRHGRAEVADRPSHELHQLVLVHRRLPLLAE